MVQEPSTILPPSNLYAVFPSPVLPPRLPALKRLQWQCKSRFPLSHPLNCPALSLSIDLSDSNTMSVLPLPHTRPALPGPGYSRIEGSPTSPSTRPHDSTGTPRRCHHPSACRAIADHRSRWRSHTESSEQFDVVSPPSVNAVNGGRRNGHVGAHTLVDRFCLTCFA